MKLFTAVMAFTLIIFNGSLMAQAMSNDSAFEQTQISALKNWLKQTNLGQTFTFKESKLVNNSKYQFTFSIPGIKAWTTFEDSLTINSLPAASQFIGNKVTFLFDVQPGNSQLIFEGTDGAVIVSFNGRSFESEIQYSQGNIDQAQADVAFTGKIPSKYTSFFDIDIRKNYSLQQYKKNLLQTIQEMCKGHSTLLNEYKISTDLDIESDLRVTITNIKKMVLDESYFEKIDMWFLIDLASKKIKCQYGCKYSAGNFWTPKDERYTDASADFPQAVEDFGNKLKSRIYNSL